MRTSIVSLQKRLIFDLFFGGLCVFCLAGGIEAQSGWQDPGVNNSVNAVAVQEDGKIVVGGTFTTVGGQPRQRVARLNDDGTLDMTFSGTNINGQGVFSIALQQDGKILAGGDFQIGGNPVNLVRFNQDGSRDLSFNPVVNGLVWTIAPQSDGTIFLGGEFVSVSGQTRNKIARINADGSIDLSFQDPGISSTLFESAIIYVIAAQSDGKIVVGGFFDRAGGQSRTAVTRLDSDGTLDMNFQDPGAAGGTGTTINHLGNQTVVNSIAIQADGKILIGGAFASVGGQTRSNLARLDPDGSLDLTLENASLTNVSNTFLSGLVLQPDGRVLIAGFFDSVAGETRRKGARVHSDGTLDPTFVDPAVSDGAVQTLALQSDGKLLIGGFFTSVGGRPRRRLTRLTSTGALDVPASLTLTVTKTEDTNDGLCDADCSLREAIAAANASESDDTVQFDPSVFGSSRTIALISGQLAVCNSGSLTVNGTGSNQLVISGNNQSRVFRVFPGGNAILNDITIADGNATSGALTGCPPQGGIDASVGGGGSKVPEHCRSTTQ